MSRLKQNLKQKKARHDLEVAVAAMLLGRDEIKSALREHFSDAWGGFVEDVVNGTKVNDEAVGIIAIFLRETVTSNMTDDDLSKVLNAVRENNFGVTRPAIFDVVAQVGYFSFLFENSDDATKGLSSLFLSDAAKLFADEPVLRERVRKYLVESVVRFREMIKDTHKRRT